jgi:hypothetical protein
MHQASTRAYLQEFCRRDLTRGEILRYLEDNPIMFGVFGLNQDYFRIYTRTTGDRYFYTDILLKVLGRRLVPLGTNPGVRQLIAKHHEKIYNPEYSPRIGDRLEDTGLDDYFTHHCVDEVMEYLEKPGRTYTGQQSGIDRELPMVLVRPQLDLLSTYRILQTRLDCISRQTDFAQAEVIRRLDDIYQYYQQHPNVLSLLATYGYLNFQGMVLNIYPLPREPDIAEVFLTLDGQVIEFSTEDWDQNVRNQRAKHGIELMNNEIEPLYLRVRQALQNLPLTKI